MSALLAILQEEHDAGRWILFILFFVLPLGLRILRKIAEQFGLVKSEDPEAEEPAASARRVRERQRLEREARRRSEQEGEERWRALARGEESARPAPAPMPARVPEAERAPTLSLELEVEPEPLATLGKVLEPSDVRVTSLESEEAPLPLAASLAATQAPARSRRGRWRVGRSEMRRAVVLAEVLGTPISER